MNRLSSVIRSFKALQRAPKPVRKKWQWGASAVSMAIVILGWVLSLNLSLAPIGNTPAEDQNTPGVLATLERGFEVLSERIAAEWARLRDAGSMFFGELGAQLSHPSAFTFVREETPLAPEPYEPISSQTLPVR